LMENMTLKVSVSWLERFPYKEDVIGSSPVGPTTRSITKPRVTSHFCFRALALLI